MSDEIPTDIRAAAIKCAETVCRNLPYENCEIEISAISRALLAERLAERERCAKVADREAEGRSAQHYKAKEAGKKTEARDYETMAIAADQVASAIRSSHE